MSELTIDSRTGMVGVCSFGECKNEEGLGQLREGQLLCPDHLPKCQANLDPYGTNQLCGQPADCDDEDFKYPMCEEHAMQAWGCMDADADMLANAY